MSAQRRGTRRYVFGEVRVKPSEQLLIDVVPELSAQNAVCTSLGRGQFAAALAEHLPQARVTCLFLDLYQARQAQEHHAGEPSNLSIVCEPDLPGDDLDLVAIPTRKTGEAELTRDLLQAGHLALKPAGRLVASVDHVDDKWLHQEMQRLFEKVTRRPVHRGIVYLATKREPLKKPKNFEARFAFRDEGRLIQAVSRPGVFSHRRVDPGARALMNAMEVRPGGRVLDLGCGSGVLALAAALRAEGVEVIAVDSHARAVQCVRQGAELNDLANVTAVLDADACRHSVPAGSFDLVVANPPYYSHYKIATIFLEGALHVLKPGGRVQVVSKQPEWYEEQMRLRFDAVTVEEAKTYYVLTGRQRDR